MIGVIISLIFQLLALFFVIGLIGMVFHAAIAAMLVPVYTGQWAYNKVKQYFTTSPESKKLFNTYPINRRL